MRDNEVFEAVVELIDDNKDEAVGLVMLLGIINDKGAPTDVVGLSDPMSLTGQSVLMSQDVRQQKKLNWKHWTVQYQVQYHQLKQ